MSLLAVRDLVAGYGRGDEILRGAHLTVEDAEIVAVIGPNGAGKSTLLKTIAGLLHPAGGSIRLRGEPIHGLAPREVSRRGVAFVPQEQNIFAALSVRENLEMGGWLEPAATRRRIDDVFARFPMLAERRGRAARTLSGGQRQVLAMAMALMVQPVLLLLDEPSAGLSPIAAEQLFATIRAINRDGIAIVMVEQNATQALAIAHRASILVDGRNNRDGAAAVLAADPEIRRIFLGAAPTEQPREVMMLRFTRRGLLQTTAAAIAAPASAGAEGEALRLGVLTPLTGAGSFDGPRMLKAMQAVADEINAAGGLLGRRIALVVEDDETNPEAAVRAAQKLVNVDRVPVIMGTWASAVTTAVAPVCWESRTFLTTVSGADSITHLPHQGYLIRTQPNNELQATKHAGFIIRHGAKRVFIMAIQAPFAEPTRRYLTDTLMPADVAVVGSLIYDKDKTSYRSEVDQALRGKPDFLYLNGYAPDVAVVLRDLYRAGFDGDRLCQSYALTAKSLDALPKEVTQGVYTVQPSADVDSPAYAAAARRLGIAPPDSYETQATDWISIVALTIAKAGEASGTAIRDTVRKITNSDAATVYTALDGLAALKQGREIKYSGASGPCSFTEIGDIFDCRFRYNRVDGGAFRLLEVS